MTNYSKDQDTRTSHKTTNCNKRSCLPFSFLTPDRFCFSRNTIKFQKYFWCSRFSRFDCKLAWDQAPHCGEKGKKLALAKKKKSRSACFARRYFSYLTPFFAFFPQCGAWSQANCYPKSFFTIRSQRHLLLTPGYK